MRQDDLRKWSTFLAGAVAADPAAAYDREVTRAVNLGERRLGDAGHLPHPRHDTQPFLSRCLPVTMKSVSADLCSNQRPRRGTS
jgi:hypothetical protein